MGPLVYHTSDHLAEGLGEGTTLHGVYKSVCGPKGMEFEKFWSDKREKKRATENHRF